MRSVLKPLCLAALLSASTASFADLVKFEASNGPDKSPFSIVFDSADNELLFTEIVSGGFNGVTFTNPTTQISIFYDELTHIPSLAAANVDGLGDYFLTAGGDGFPSQGGCTVDRWCFAISGSNQGTNSVVSGWGNYSVTSVTSVPEPGSMALAGLALAGLGFSRRRKTR